MPTGDQIGSRWEIFFKKKTQLDWTVFREIKAITESSFSLNADRKSYNSSRQQVMTYGLSNRVLCKENGTDLVTTTKEYLTR